MQLSKNLHNAGLGLDAKESYALCLYVSHYIQYELYELKKTRADIDADMIADAINAFQGGCRAIEN